MELLIFLGLALAAMYAFAIGANDMANVIATLVGGRVTSYRVAVLIFTVSVTLGSLLQGYMVMKTLGKGVVKNLDLYGAVSASLAALTWVLVATKLGLPVSTSQSVTSAVLGSGLAIAFTSGTLEGVNINVVKTIITSWMISPVLAMFTAALAYIVLEKTRLNEETTKVLALAIAFWNGYSFGANDVGNATGVYLALAGSLPFLFNVRGSILLALYGTLFIALGGLIMGKKVVETMGFKITRLDPLGSLSSSLVTATSVWMFTTVPYMLFGYGLPVSTTYISVGAITGVGIAKYRSFKKGLNLKLLLTILLSWVLTLPTNILLSMCFYYGLINVFTGA
ncbi:MAG: inorganic phosphate transporter [Desulfurococcaceae archaeon]